jgi:hypothetical protein
MEDRVGSGEAEVAAQHTGPREAAPPAVAASTLAVAAFSARLRDQLDLDTLSSELLGVVDRTVQLAGVSLWLRPRPDPVRDGTVTMPERWGGTTAPEEVP